LDALPKFQKTSKFQNTASIITHVLFFLTHLDFQTSFGLVVSFFDVQPYGAIWEVPEKYDKVYALFVNEAAYYEKKAQHVPGPRESFHDKTTDVDLE
jgi:hypothetical protein